jgi:hypothetical protein
VTGDARGQLSPDELLDLADECVRTRSFRLARPVQARLLLARRKSLVAAPSDASAQSVVPRGAGGFIVFRVL